MKDEAAPFERPDPKILMVWTYSSAISYAVFGLLFSLPALLLLALGRPKPLLFVFVLAPLLLWLLTKALLRRQWERWGFRVTPRTVEIRKGLVWRSYRIVARDRIQHVDINSGPLDRKFGLVQVVIYTAGTAVGMIPGLTPERAESLRIELSASMDPSNQEKE